MGSVDNPTRDISSNPPRIRYLIACRYLTHADCEWLILRDAHSTVWCALRCTTAASSAHAHCASNETATCTSASFGFRAGWRSEHSGDIRSRCSAAWTWAECL